jgi:hypothetical protein
MPVGAGGDNPERDPVAFAGHRAFKSAFASVDRRGTGLVPTADGLGDAPVHRQILQVQSDDPVVGGQGHGMDPLRDTSVGPFSQPAPDRPVRAGLGGDPLVSRAMNQRIQEMIEHHPIRYPASVTAQRMVRMEPRTWTTDRGFELDPDRFEQARWDSRHGTPGDHRA